MKLNIKRLDILLAEKCLSSAELCKRSEISTVTIGKLRNGHIARPRTIGKIAKALEVDVIELIAE